MTHDEMLTLIRTRFASLCDPDWKEKDWEIFLSVGPGWYPLVIEFLERVDAHLLTTDWHGRFYLRQIKEKFGSLRIILRAQPLPGSDQDEWDATKDVPREVYEPLGVICDDIYSRADHTCEECGNPGKRRPELSLVQTLCDEHFDEHMRERKRRKNRAKAEKRKQKKAAARTQQS